jgi:hypothetical protein
MADNDKKGGSSWSPWPRELHHHHHFSVSPGMATCIIFATTAFIGYKVWARTKK